MGNYVPEFALEESQRLFFRIGCLAGLQRLAPLIVWGSNTGEHLHPAALTDVLIPVNITALESFKNRVWISLALAAAQFFLRFVATIFRAFMKSLLPSVVSPQAASFQHLHASTQRNISRQWV
jgi:hypothetical protein